MYRKKPCLIFSLLIIAAILTATVVYAAGYYPHYYEQSPPDWGQWWWTNGVLITWENTNWWDDVSATALRYHWAGGNDPTFEVEGYDPGNRTDCDKLNVYRVTIYNLPVTSYEIINGDCPGNSPVYREQVDIHIKGDNSFQSQVWYDHWVEYQKVGFGNGEVNFSYEVSCCCNDCWLGKIEYNSNYDAICANPQGVISSLPGCP